MNKKQMTLSEFQSKGGKARAKKLTKKRRKEIAIKAGTARWDKARSAKKISTGSILASKE